MVKKGLIFVNGFYRPPSLTYQIERFTACFKARGIELGVVDNQRISVYIDGENTVSTLPETDFIIYLDKDRHIAHMLEKAGYRLFNSATAIELCDDKIRTYIALANCGLQMPRTYSSPIMYKSDTDDAAFVRHIEQNLRYPIVVKEAYGSLGMQVYLAKNAAQLRNIRESVKYKPHLYQEYVGERFGTDVRLLLVGGRVIAAILRKSDSDFRSNIEQGGRAYAYEPSAAFIASAESAARILGLDYCGVDMLFGAGGIPVICEVNSNAFFSASEAVTGVDIANCYVEYISQKIYQ